MPLALVICTAILGATFLAALHPAPKEAFEATGTVVVPADSPGLEQRTRQVANLLRQPSMMAVALEATQSSDEAGSSAGRLSVKPDLSAGVVEFRVRGTKSDEARRLGEELSAAVVKGLRLGRSAAGRLAPQVAGDFEYGLDDWSATGPENQLATIARTPEGRYGDGALRIRCVGGEGCGAARSLNRPVRALRSLAVTAWVRSRQPSRVRLTLGTCCDDGAIGRPERVNERWRRLEVGWTPRSGDRKTVVLAMQSANPGPSEVDLDAVALRDTRSSPEAPPPAEERRRFGQSTGVVATPVRVVSSGDGSTLAWGAIGAGLGLLIGLIGVVAARLARRRIGA